MRPLMVLIIGSALSACVSQTEKPVIVEVPVREACIDEMPSVPDWETKHLRADDSLCAITDALLIERQQHMIYIKQLKAAMAGCMKEGEQWRN